jgi:DNA-binding NarL/FixJ family response regulator
VDEQITVVLADDAVLVREALANLLTQHGFQVLAQVADADSLHRTLETTRPTVVVLDIRMPPEYKLDGLRAAVEIRRRHPQTGVLVLSQYLESHYLSTLLGRGVRGIGYLLKERVAGTGAFLDAVRDIAAGGCVVDPAVVSRMISARRHHDRLARLSEREREILGLMAQGRSNQAICRQLVLTKKTVESHVRSILLRLDIPPEPDYHRRVLAVLTYLRPPYDQPYPTATG